MLRCPRQADIGKWLIAPALAAFMVTGAGAFFPLGAESLRKVDSRLDAVQSQLSEQKKQEEFLSRKSHELLTEEQALQSEEVSVARRVQQYESELTDIEDKLVELENREKDATTALEDKAGQYARILMALERLSTTPPEALIALPRSPQDTLRSAILLKAALPGVEQHAKDLKRELGEITDLRSTIKTRRSELGDVTAKLRDERESLSRLLDDKRQLRQDTEDEAREAARAVQKMAMEAKTLGELLASIKNRADGLPSPREKPDYELVKDAPDSEIDDVLPSSPTQTASLNTPAGNRNTAAKTGDAVKEAAVASSITEARGHLRMPAAGKIVTLFGERSVQSGLPGGAHAKGIEIETRPEAQVVSPFDGKVVFAGPFRGYGRLLIIEHGEGYHSLVAGFDRLDSVVGQYVLAGEPVGTMGENRPKLYLEMRHDGEAINPLPWLASQNGKVSG
ncbi:murein hydrolase activator EnvC [Thalassospira sp. MCCC 1A01428]|uniref:murein hydrolase activator EnvC family protein n=1 Tax=Thalassospira sp. MCCC 1A01428 TaxID=1470575 RepID=UPI000A200E27|nr:peptidoglycan DD-metalloendopeptidase family protein [Thalassospira sp. MCCC 1A01428]OSQ45091.1 peptidase M23 [Thalassospira sp. MCCC 1A01428]